MTTGNVEVERSPLLGSRQIASLAGGLLFTAVVAVSFPVAAYSIGLACFGLTHVLTELRYVNQRFSSRLSPVLQLAFGILLILVICVRCLAISQVLTTEVGLSIELGIVAILVLLVLPYLWSSGWLTRVGTIGFLGALVIGTWYAPLTTILVFAMLHNLTPIGFLFERLRGSQRQQTMLLCLGAFVVVPLIIMSGWPHQLLSGGGWVHQNVNFFQLPSLVSQLGAYVPPVAQQNEWSLHYFCAAVYLQCLHYGVVIGILPRLGSGWAIGADAAQREEPRPWLTNSQFNWLLIGLGTLLWVWFTKSFIDARRFYGLLAAIHAWLEIPILLLVLAGLAQKIVPPFAMTKRI
jgi:hypothetical protein